MAPIPISRRTQLYLELAASAALVAAVLFGMWRLPRSERFYAWGPPLALISAWMGLFAVLGSAMLWLVSVPDVAITLMFLLLDPAAIAAGVLVLWIYRGHQSGNAPGAQTIEMQLLQSRVGVGLGVFAVAIGYIFVFWHHAPDITL